MNEIPLLTMFLLLACHQLCLSAQDEVAPRTAPPPPWWRKPHEKPWGWGRRGQPVPPMSCCPWDTSKGTYTSRRTHTSRRTTDFMGHPQGEPMGHGPPHLQPTQAALAPSYLCVHRSAINQEPWQCNLYLGNLKQLQNQPKRYLFHKILPLVSTVVLL